VRVAVLVVQNRAALNGLLRHFRRDVDVLIGIRHGRFDGQFQSIEGIARVATATCTRCSSASSSRSISRPP